MAIRSDARLGGSMPQHNRVPFGPGIKPLFHSVRDIALILDKTVKAGYGVIKSGTVMAVCSITGNLYPYPETLAGSNNTNAKAYLTANPGDGAVFCNVGIEDSYKFQVGDELIMDGSGAGVAEVQEIAILDAAVTTADVFTLVIGTTTLTATIGATATVVGLTTLLKADASYAACPFVITETANSKIILTWKAIGAITGLAVLTEATDGDITATETTPGEDYQEGALAAENLGAIISIDRTAVNSTQATITFTTAITNYANFTSTYFGNVYVKGGDASTPFTAAKFIIDADVDSGTGEFAVGALTSVVVSNAVLYTGSLIGYDAAAIVDLGSVDDGRFTILK